MCAGLALGGHAGDPEPTTEQIDALLIRAIKQGVTSTSPGPVPVGAHVVLAAGVAGRYASVIVLRRDSDDESDLLDDTYFLSRDESGRWVPPGGWGGGSNPEWVLYRPEHGSDVPTWQGELVALGGQWAMIGDQWITDLTMMASRVVVEVEATYVGHRYRRVVPPNGVLTIPVVLGDVDDVACFDGFDQAGLAVAKTSYWPVPNGGLHPAREWETWFGPKTDLG